MYGSEIKNIRLKIKKKLFKHSLEKAILLLSKKKPLKKSDPNDNIHLCFKLRTELFAWNKIKCCLWTIILTKIMLSDKRHNDNREPWTKLHLCHHVHIHTCEVMLCRFEHTPTNSFPIPQINATLCMFSNITTKTNIHMYSKDYLH